MPAHTPKKTIKTFKVPLPAVKSTRSRKEIRTAVQEIKKSGTISSKKTAKPVFSRP